MAKVKKTNDAPETVNPASTEQTSDLHPYFFHQGTDIKIYEYLGCHKLNDGGYVFRTWAPRAEAVYLVGDFVGWDSKELPLTRIDDGGIWEIKYNPDFCIHESHYKYLIVGGGREAKKCDPYAVYNETREKTASFVYELPEYKWHDEKWLSGRKDVVWGKDSFYPSPMNVYEVHLGSWRTKNSETTADNDAFLNYREIADQLAPYLVEMGYTHVELLPILEHPYDGSWGYQVCGYYSPSSRFGRPEDFMYFVDTLHSHGIGVIIDWVPAHFPKDEHGLFEFDGHPTYEYQSPLRMEHPVWGTRFLDVGRNEVQCFLIANVLYWARHYHVDGIRVDAVAAMLYLDCDRMGGNWEPNIYGENKNLEAIAFFRKLNDTVHAEIPDLMMIAEESTAWPLITQSPAIGGLGFNFKWNMGWMNDMFEYVQCDPMWRSHNHSKLTFPMMYAYSENYILPVSHDEVVHGKKSLLDKQFGPYEQKFNGMRAFLTYMMTFPGKKLLFMGQEFGQFREWDYENQLEWFMLDYHKHRELKNFVATLNHLYLDTPAMWEIDTSWDGFEWIYADDAARNVVAYKRKDRSGGEIYAVVNFSGSTWTDYKIPVPVRGKYSVLINSDWTDFGGSTYKEGNDAYFSHRVPEPKQPRRKKGDPPREKPAPTYELSLTLKPLSGVIIKKK